MENQTKDVYEKDSRRKRQLQRVAPLLAGAAIGSGGLLLAQRFVPAPFEKSCSAVSSAELDRVNQFLAHPISPRLASITHEKNIFKEESDLRRYIDQQAAKDGFTLVNDAPYQDELLHTTSPAKMLEIVNNFSEHYGFKVTTAGHFDSQRPNKSKSDKEALAADFSIGASSLMAIFHFLPLEIAKYSEIKQIRIVNTLPGIQAANVSPDRTMTVTYDSFVAGDYSLYMHELGHLVDFEECGDEKYISQPDQQYLSLNPKKFKYGKQTKWSWVGITASPYGGTNVLEDKAEIYKYMLNGLDPVYFNSPYQVVREKYHLLLARLDKEIPGIASYLASISVRKPVDEAPIDSQYEQAAPGILKDRTD